MTTIPPKIGHARLKETYAGLEISIPAKNRRFIMIFMPVWFAGWAIGGGMFAKSVLNSSAGESPDRFIQVWLVFWAFGGIMALAKMLRMLWIKEIIRIEPGKLELKRTALFRKPEVYDLQQAKNFRTQQEQPDTSLRFGNMNAFTLEKGKHGTLCFEYDLKTVEFASGLQEPEARSLLKLFLERDLLRKENLLSGLSY